MTFIGLNCGQVPCRDKIYTDTKSRWFLVSLAICSLSFVRKGFVTPKEMKEKKVNFRLASVLQAVRGKS